MPRKFTLFRKRKSKAKRSLWVTLLVLLAFSGWQYIELGKITWHQTLFDEARDYVEQQMSSWTGSDDQSELPLPSRGQQLIGRAVKVTDGDTLKLRTSDRREYTIRLHGIDAPEHDQPYGNASSAALARMIINREIKVRVEDIDRYARLVGTVEFDGDNINLAMVRDGHAWWYRQYARSIRELEAAEAAAKEKRIGLWTNDKPVPPWLWRRQQ
jgi:endonuclease YncB( thermonuclease family)